MRTLPFSICFGMSQHPAVPRPATTKQGHPALNGIAIGTLFPSEEPVVLPLRGRSRHLETSPVGFQQLPSEDQLLTRSPCGEPWANSIAGTLIRTVHILITLLCISFFFQDPAYSQGPTISGDELSYEDRSALDWLVSNNYAYRIGEHYYAEAQLVEFVRIYAGQGMPYIGGLLGIYSFWDGQVNGELPRNTAIVVSRRAVYGWIGTWTYQSNYNYPSNNPGHNSRFTVSRLQSGQYIVNYEGIDYGASVSGAAGNILNWRVYFPSNQQDIYYVFTRTGDSYSGTFQWSMPGSNASGTVSGSRIN